MTVGNIDLVELLSTFQGRINRAKFWIAILVFFVVQIAVAIVAYILSAIGLSFVGMILAAVVYIAMAVAGVFVGIKRLHDRGKSGWWLLVFMFAPSILTMIGFMLGTVIGTIFSLASLAIVVWSIVELGCLKGDSGANQYGPDPLAGLLVAA